MQIIKTLEHLLKIHAGVAASWALAYSTNDSNLRSAIVFIQLTFLGDKCEYDSDPVGIVAKLTGRTVEAA